MKPMCTHDGTWFVIDDAGAPIKTGLATEVEAWLWIRHLERKFKPQTTEQPT